MCRRFVTQALTVLALALLGMAAQPCPLARAEGPVNVVITSQPSFTAPGAVIPVQVSITGTAQVDSLYAQYDLGQAPLSGAGRYRTADARGLSGPNLLQWLAPTPQSPTDSVCYRIVAVTGGAAVPVAAGAIPFGRRLNSGSAKAAPDGSGAFWEADRPWLPGTYGYEGVTRVITTAEAIRGTANYGEDELCQTQRTSVDGIPFRYRFYYGTGIYQARLQIELRFAELEKTAAGQRVFDVLANGEPLVTGLDLYAAAGARKALVVSREVTVTYRTTSEPVLDITFVPRVGEAAVAGVAVRAISAIPQYSATIQVGAWPDDAHMVLNRAGSMNREAFVRFGRYSDGFEYAAGLLFRRLPPPQGALVSRAWLELWSFPAVGWQYGQADVSIYAQAADSAPDFNTNQPHVTARPLSTNEVRWIIDRSWPASQAIESANLAPLVQEVIDRPHWRPGNNLALLILPNLGRIGWRDIVAWDWPRNQQGIAGESRAARLHILYVPPEFRKD